MAEVPKQFPLPSGEPEMQPRWKTPFGGSISQGAGETIQNTGQVLMRGGFALLGLGMAKQSNTPGLAPAIAGIGNGIADVLQQRWWRKEAEFFDEKYTKPYSQTIQMAYQKFAAETSPVTITKEIQIPDKEGKTVTKTVPVTGFPLSRDPKTGQVTDVIPGNTEQGISFYSRASQELNSTIANSTIQYLDSTGMPMFKDNPIVAQKAASIHQMYTKWTGQVTGGFKDQMELGTELTKQDKNKALTEKAEFETYVAGPAKLANDKLKAEAAMVRAQRTGLGRGGRGSSSTRIDPKSLTNPADILHYVTNDKNHIAAIKAAIENAGLGSESKLDEGYDVNPKTGDYTTTYRDVRQSVMKQEIGERVRYYTALNLKIPLVRADEVMLNDPTTRQYSNLYNLALQYDMVDPEMIRNLWYQSDGNTDIINSQLTRLQLEAESKSKPKEEAAPPSKGLLERLQEFGASQGFGGRSGDITGGFKK